MPNLVENQNSAGPSNGVLVTGSCVLICTGDSQFGDSVLANIEMAATDSNGEYAPTSFIFKGPGVQLFHAPNDNAEYFLRSRLAQVATDTNITIRIVQ